MDKLWLDNQSILKEISPGISLEGMMLKLKLQYFTHLMWRVDSLEKTLMLGGIGSRRRRDDRGWDGWMASLTRWTWVCMDFRSWWLTRKPGMLRFMGSQRVGHDWETELNWTLNFDTVLTSSSFLKFLLLLENYISSVQLFSLFWLFATPWTAACQTSLSITNTRSLLKLMSIESVMTSNHLILCHPFFFLPSIFPSIRVFSNESALPIRWPKCWSFSFNISPANEYSGLISFKQETL